MVIRRYFVANCVEIYSFRGSDPCGGGVNSSISHVISAYCWTHRAGNNGHA